MRKLADMKGERRRPHIEDRRLAISLHAAAAALRHSADLIDLAADSAEPGEGRAYLRLCVSQAGDDLKRLPPRSAHRR